MAQVRPSAPHRTGYAGLDFIKAAFCPLEFNAKKFADHPDYRSFRKDEGLAALEIGEPLSYPRKFPYTDQSGHRRTGTQMVNAYFGLAPADFDLFLGLFTYLKKLPQLPADGRSYLTVDFIARQLGLPASGGRDYLRLRSRIFRLSYVKYTNSAFWNPQSHTYDIVNFGLWNLAGLARLTESRRPVALEWDPTLLRILASSSFLTFDYDLYRTLSQPLRRLYLIANRDGWNQRDSSIFVADDFTVHQVGYDEKPQLAKLRRHKLRRILAEAEALDLIRPYQPWKGYFQTIERGPNAGRKALRWSRGPALKAKEERPGRVFTDRVENDALFAQVQELRDEESKPASPAVYRRLVAKYGRDLLQKHVVIVLAQKENFAGTFTKSELAAFINRLQHDHPEPDWYRDLKRSEQLSPFQKVEPNQLSMELYETFFRA